MSDIFRKLLDQLSGHASWKVRGLHNPKRIPREQLPGGLEISPNVRDTLPHQSYMGLWLSRLRCRLRIHAQTNHYRLKCLQLTRENPFARWPRATTAGMALGRTSPYVCAGMNCFRLANLAARIRSRGPTLRAEACPDAEPKASINLLGMSRKPF